MLDSFKEMIKYKALIKALVIRHLSVRYRGSVLGFFWTLLNPLFLMLVYLLVFKFYVRFEDVDNYEIFLFCGLLPWIWISSSLIEGSTAIVSSGHLITKSMFPAQILPIVSSLTGLINYLFSLPLLICFMLIFGEQIHYTIIFLPILILIQLLMIYGFSLILSALNVKFRDVQHVIANILNLMFFLCPILYPRTTVPENLRFTLDFNPFAALITVYHNLILDGKLPSLTVSLYLLFFTFLILYFGNKVFNSKKESFAEYL